MIKVGLVGEDPSDTLSIKNLLERKYHKKFRFIPLVKRIKGNHLDATKIRSSLKIEFKDKKCRFVIYVRDLDAFESERGKVDERHNWFKSLDKDLGGKGILLLNIWELEALILADIETFNKSYKTKFNFRGNPMLEKEPKETLKRVSAKGQKQYHESQAPNIFKELDINLLQTKCKFFGDFITELDKK